jgi:hypothetical protein
MKLPLPILKAWFYEKLLRLRVIAFFRKHYYRWRIRRGVYVLNSLDDWMTDAGYKRHERRQFWREFTAKQGAREKLWERMAE